MKKTVQFIKDYPFVAGIAGIIVLSIVLTIAGYGRIGDILLGGYSLLMAVKLGYGMIETLREGRYGIDILAVTAIIATVVVGEYWAAGVIVLMLTGGEALEDYAEKRAKKELDALLERAPRTAHKILPDGTTVTVKLSQINPGDMLLIRPSEVVPVDSVLQDKIAEFDESSLTGESLPVEHKAGDELLSGSVNGTDSVTVKALRTAKESQYQQIIELVKAAASSEAPFVRLADRYAVPFTIISYVIAGTAWAISGEGLRFAQVLVVATPCPLLLGAPIALISGMSRSAKNGIIVKSGAILERLSKIKTVAFDKTGTLTHGEPELSVINPEKGFTANQLLQYAASAEQQSVHVLAQALVGTSNKKSVKLFTPKNLKETTAMGVAASVNGKKVLVGKAAFLTKAKISVPKTLLSGGETAVFVAVDNKFAGYITFRDRVRPEAKNMIQSLKILGVGHTMMLTGDAEATAARIAKELKISDYTAECLPLDKVNAVKAIKDRPVLMVGDGVNDAPVLAVADVGMAMGARGSTAASETADVVVLVDDISKGSLAISIAKDTIHIALQSIWIGIAISVGLMLLASTGRIPAVVGAGLQEVVDVVVIINALRAHGPWGR